VAAASTAHQPGLKAARMHDAPQMSRRLGQWRKGAPAHQEVGRPREAGCAAVEAECSLWPRSSARVTARWLGASWP